MNPFIPQVEPYNASKDILNAYMMIYEDKLQKKSSLTKLMKELDPVQLMKDEFRIQQYDKIKELEDRVVNLYRKPPKGRITNEDLFNMQYEFSNFEKWQDELLMKDKILTSEMGLARTDKFQMDAVKMTEFINSKGDYFPPADENGLHFVTEVFPSWEELKSGYNPFDDTYTSTDIKESEGGKYNSVTTNRYGGEDELLPNGDTNTRGQWYTKRVKGMANNLINNREWKGSAKQAYSLESPEVKSKYDEMWMKQKTSPS